MRFDVVSTSLSELEKKEDCRRDNAGRFRFEPDHTCSLVVRQFELYLNALIFIDAAYVIDCFVKSNGSFCGKLVFDLPKTF